MNPATERAWIGRLVAGMPRSPHQINRVHESDAELVRIPGTEVVLAVTTDGIAEEIVSGLYGDPYLAGWMSVVVNASDLAAVGAEPLGLLVSESIPPDMSAEDVQRLQKGIGDAARTHALPLLGGDTNTSSTLHLTGTAIGILRDGFLTRRGAKPGDRLFASASLGLGSAFAFERLMATPKHTGRTRFQPVARLNEGRLLASWATACMDTSDGTIATLDELLRINGIGIRADVSLEEVLHPAAHATARIAGLPPWTMLAGPHGEFELLFTIPSERRDAFVAAAEAIRWHPIELGEITPQTGLRWWIDGAWLSLDTTRIRNLFTEVHGDPHRYLEALLNTAAPRPASTTALPALEANPRSGGRTESSWNLGGGGR